VRISPISVMRSRASSGRNDCRFDAALSVEDNSAPVVIAEPQIGGLKSLDVGEAIQNAATYLDVLWPLPGPAPALKRSDAHMPTASKIALVKVTHARLGAIGFRLSLDRGNAYGIVRSVHRVISVRARQANLALRRFEMRDDGRRMCRRLM
jgi:hypothetical protein